MTGQALLTRATEAGGTRDDVVAHGHSGDVLADGFDDARALVTHQDGAIHRVARGAVGDVQVAVAHATGDRAHQDLAAKRLVHLDILDSDRLEWFIAKDDGTHLHQGFCSFRH